MRSLVQGDPSAPSLFNLILDGPAYEYEQECRKRGWGFSMDGFVVPIILFADNCWLLAKNPNELQEMTALWIKFLHAKLVLKVQFLLENRALSVTKCWALS